MMRRILPAAAIALAAVAAYIWLLYAFFAYVWPRLPIWANILIVILLALTVVISPLMLLLRFGQMPSGKK